jgi:uridine kinase
MQEIIHACIPIHKRSVPTDEAIDIFHKQRMYDKEKLFRYRRVSRVNLYRIEDFEDYFYGFMAYHTGYVKVFDLFLYGDGFVLLLPERKTPDVLPEFCPRTKIYQVQTESERWGESIGISYVGNLNEKITTEGIKQTILVQEAKQEARISAIAQQIKSAGDIKFVMIAGPSSSGKTTFSHRLSIQLTAHGMKPHPIALDNYFVDRERTPLDEDGEKDYERLEAIDVEQFNRDMLDLLAGKEVELPVYNFKTGHREYRGDFLKLGDEDILVIEGIHGLNDRLSYALPRENKFKIYISALTQLNIDEHNRIPTTDGRLIRRMVRDARTRGISAKETIARWPSVRRGEEKYIFPYQEEADAMFDSALIYELACLKVYAEPLLFGIGKQEPEYQEAKRLLKFFDYFVPVPSEAIPYNSILREFVGGSCFEEFV